MNGLVSLNPLKLLVLLLFLIIAILIGNNISTVVLTLHFFIVEYLGGIDRLVPDLCNKANIAVKQVICSCCFSQCL